MSVILYKTKFGLRLRSCGENPQAADSLGINVYKMRYAGTTISGALSGLGGFVYALTTANCASTGEVAGFGFLRFGSYDIRQLEAAFSSPGRRTVRSFQMYCGDLCELDINGDGVNAGADRHKPLCVQIASVSYYLVVLAFTSKNSSVPKAEGIPYDKGQ